MRNIKLLTALSSLPVLGMTIAPLICCGTKQTKNYVTTNSAASEFKAGKYVISISNSSSSITFYTPVQTEELTDINWTYTYDKFFNKLSETDCDILVGGQSIKNEEGVIYTNGEIKIPAKLITNNIEIKIITKSLLLTNKLNDIYLICNSYEQNGISKNDLIHRFETSTGKIQTEDELIGCLIKLNINGKEHYARIIDVEHDTIAEGVSAGKKAALTFDMATLLSDSNGDALLAHWDDNTNIDPVHVSLRANLTGGGNTLRWFNKDGTESSETRTVLQMLADETTGSSNFAKNIKIVNKEVAVYGGYKVDTYTDKLFALTYREMAQSYSGYAIDEGTEYTYWKNNLADDDLIKRDCNGNVNSYWLATAKGSREYQYEAWHINQYGHSAITSMHDNDSVSFGFCI